MKMPNPNPLKVAEIASEYRFDYSKAKPNRFAEKMNLDVGWTVEKFVAEEKKESGKKKERKSKKASPAKKAKPVAKKPAAKAKPAKKKKIINSIPRSRLDAGLFLDGNISQEYDVTTQVTT